MANEEVQTINVMDMDQEAIDRKFEMMTAEEAKMMARNFGAPDALYDLFLEIKRDDFYWAEFIYNGVKYWLYAEHVLNGNELQSTGQWILKSEGIGKLRHMVCGTKEELVAAPEFEGKTIEEIADQISDFEISRTPVYMD